MKSQTKQFLVKPRIYEFSCGGNWGWCRVGDLVQIFNDHMRMYSIKIRTNPEDFFKRYIGLERNDVPSGKVWNYKGQSAWPRDTVCLGDFFDRQAYVAAGWAMKVLKVLQSAGIVKTEFIEGEIRGYNATGDLLLRRTKPLP
jgi:hypothetical protein